MESDHMRRFVCVLVVLDVMFCIAAPTSKCRHCNLIGYGRGCVYAPDGVHRM